MLPERLKPDWLKDVGAEKAAEIYAKLIELNQQIIGKIEADIFIYYSDYPEQNDGWLGFSISRKVQLGENLGERMNNAFADVFEMKYAKATIIGSDCASLTADIVNDGFALLDKSDVVIGPAEDGGYYLLAIKRPSLYLFKQMEWSTQHVFDKSVLRIKEAGQTYTLLPTLNDIDNLQDLESEGLSHWL